VKVNVVVVLSAVILVSGCSATRPALRQAEPTPSRADCAELAPLLTPLVEQRWVASASLALIANGRKTLCSFGNIGGPGSPLASADTLYEIGSLTKLFTGALLAEQVQSGAVRLEQPVTDIIALPLPEGRRAPTLLELATHRSGLPRMPGNMSPRDATNPYADYDQVRLFDFFRSTELEPAPASYRYSNLGAALLGVALAYRYRSPYERLVDERLLKPLGMNDTYFTVPSAASARTAQGHDADDAPQHAWDFDALAPAGALRSTARDMARFLEAALPDARTPLSGALSFAAAPRAEAANGRRIGLFFQTRADGSIWHNGETGGFASYLAVDPARSCGVVLLLSTAFERSDELGDKLLAFARGQRITPFALPPAFDVPGETLADYEGDYDLSAELSLHVERQGATGLHVRATGQRPFRLWPAAADRFYLRGVKAHVTFERDDEGRVAALVLDQGGERSRAERRAP
jgi:serine-type D-Ala-D-Ala carboxypeptidase/endopeptidase